MSKDEGKVISMGTPWIQQSKMEEGQSFRGFLIGIRRTTDNYKEAKDGSKMQKDVYEIEITEAAELPLYEDGEQVTRKLEVGEYAQFDSRCKANFERAMNRGVKLGQELQVTYKGEDTEAKTNIKPKIYELKSFENYKTEVTEVVDGADMSIPF